jgi:hypothetical protein
MALGWRPSCRPHGKRVVEVGRPKRPPRRSGAKSDALDVVRAAREALAEDHMLAPRRRAGREALRFCWPPATAPVWLRSGHQPQGMIVGAPEELRAELRGLTTKHHVGRCANPLDRLARSLEHRMTVRALRSTARRIQLLAAEAHGQRVWHGPRPAGVAARRAERPTRVLGTIRPDPGSSWSPAAASRPPVSWLTSREIRRQLPDFHRQQLVEQRLDLPTHQPQHPPSRHPVRQPNHPLTSYGMPLNSGHFRGSNEPNAGGPGPPCSPRADHGLG